MDAFFSILFVGGDNPIEVLVQTSVSTFHRLNGVGNIYRLNIEDHLHHLISGIWNSGPAVMVLLLRQLMLKKALSREISMGTFIVASLSGWVQEQGPIRQISSPCPCVHISSESCKPASDLRPNKSDH